MSNVNQDMALEDFESALRLLADMGSVIRTDHLSAEAKLHAIDGAITEAIGGSMEKARDLARDVSRGPLEDGS